MKIVWQVDSGDIAKVKAFYDKHYSNPFVQRRIARNLADDKPAITKQVFWRCMVRCLLTTQQRSGPNAPVARFVETNPPLLSYRICDKQNDLEQFRIIESYIRHGRSSERIPAGRPPSGRW